MIHKSLGFNNIHENAQPCTIQGHTHAKYPPWYPILSTYHLLPVYLPTTHPPHITPTSFSFSFNIFLTSASISLPLTDPFSHFLSPRCHLGNLLLPLPFVAGSVVIPHEQTTHCFLNAHVLDYRRGCTENDMGYVSPLILCLTGGWCWKCGLVVWLGQVDFGQWSCLSYTITVSCL